MQGALHIPEVVRLSGNLVRHQVGSPDCATLRKSLTSECGSNAFLILSFLFYISDEYRTLASCYNGLPCQLVVLLRNDA